MKTSLKTILMLCMVLIGLSLVSAISITDVSSSPTEVAPGEEVKITIEIKNIFSYDVENLNVKLDLSSEDVPFAPYQSSSEKFLDALDEGKEEDFKFKLISLPEAHTGIYKIPVLITYEYEGENKTLSGEKTETISVTVNSKPELRISLDDSAVLIKGKENTFSVKVINSGLSDVKFVYLSVGDSSSIKFLSEKEQYIGDIDSDDFDSAEYNAFIKSSAAGSITLSVTLTFLDATNKEFTETANIILKTYSIREARDLGLVKKPSYTAYIIIILVIVGYFVRRYFRKRKLKKLRK